MKFIAFDLEISTPIPAGATDWRPFRPFGISCAATFAQGEEAPEMWYGQQARSAFDSVPQYSDRMRKSEVCELVYYLEWITKHGGYKIVTFNGAGFDFECLAEESGMVDECKELALNHIDLFLQIFCQLGYGPGLDRLAKGMGLGEKPQGINGAAAPQMWLDGRYQEVLDYCAGDVRLTMALALEIKRLGAVQWTSKAGKSTGSQMLELMIVKESLQLPEPDTAWMTGDRLTREKLTSWLK